MNTKKQTIENKRPASVPQIQVRSNLRSGGDLETCLHNLNKWQERYYYWEDQARKAGKI